MNNILNTYSKIRFKNVKLQLLQRMGEALAPTWQQSLVLRQSSQPRHQQPIVVIQQLKAVVEW